MTGLEIDINLACLRRLLLVSSVSVLQIINEKLSTVSAHLAALTRYHPLLTALTPTHQAKTAVVKDLLESSQQQTA